MHSSHCVAKKRKLRRAAVIRIARPASKDRIFAARDALKINLAHDEQDNEYCSNNKKNFTLSSAHNEAAPN